MRSTELILTIIGPMNGVITGQSNITDALANILSRKHWRMHKLNSNFQSQDILTRLWGTIYLIYNFLLLLHKSNLFYISIKRGHLSVVVDFFMIYLIRLSNKKLVLHLHGNELFDQKTPENTMLKKMVLKNLMRADTVICLNSFQKQQLHNLGLKNISVLPNFHNFRDENEPPEKSISADEEVRIVYLSNFQKEKGFLEFLKLPQKFQSFKYDLCGKFLNKNSEEHRSYLEFEKLKSDNFTNHGFINGEAKINILKNAHFIFFPSVYPTEAQPVSLIEAMAFGCVPIVANRPYISDIVCTQNGVILSSDPGEDEIFSALVDLPNLDYRRFSQNCKAIANKHTLEAFSQKVNEIFDNV